MSTWLPNSGLCASPQPSHNDLVASPTLSLSSSQCSDLSNDSSQASIASSATSLSSSSFAWRDDFELPSQPSCSKADAATFARQQSQAGPRKACLNPSPRCGESWPANFISKRCNAIQNACTNLRRTGLCPRVKPTLVRQGERRESFVEYLVDAATLMVAVIWPNSMAPPVPGNNDPKSQVLPLRIFIKETLRRSRTSYSTLQVAMYYLILIKTKARLPRYDFTMEQAEDSASVRAMQCGRRMFLAALILASKYLQDRNYSARAWSKISGLKISEINTNELSFLAAVDWKLHISEETFGRWTDIVTQYTNSMNNFGPRAGLSSQISTSWTNLVRNLTPEMNYKTTTWVRVAANQQQMPTQMDVEPDMPLSSPSVHGTPKQSPVRSEQEARTPDDTRLQDTQLLRPPPTPLLNSHLSTPVTSPGSTASNTPASTPYDPTTMPPHCLRRIYSEARLKPTADFALPNRSRTWSDAVQSQGETQYLTSASNSRRSSISQAASLPTSRKPSLQSVEGIHSLLEAAKELDFEPSNSSAPPNAATNGLLSPPSSAESDSDSPPRSGSDTAMSSPAAPSSRRKRRHNHSLDLHPVRSHPEPLPCSSDVTMADGNEDLQAQVRARLASRAPDDTVREDTRRPKSFLLRARGASRVPVDRDWGRKRACCA